uniref:Pru domain-containing protein n=1 Tax=Trypanosoma congolense (strain IL3000) TaxID=1068625 RepID=G0UUW8_TRYCI|nr:conserved hypothetical protein [Trypanosoma congolense IL3000]
MFTSLWRIFFRLGSLNDVCAGRLPHIPLCRTGGTPRLGKPEAKLAKWCSSHRLATMEVKASALLPHMRSSGQRSTVVVKVRAGRMVLKDGVVRPLLGRGFMFLLRDTLPHSLVLAWISTDGEEQYRFQLPPGRVTVSWVEKCKPSRVMLFDVDGGRQLLFFWMQSRSDELDEPVMLRVQHVIERNNSQLAAMSGRQEIKMETLKGILSELWSEALAQDVDLADILTSEKLLSALREDPCFYAARLQEYLPQVESSCTEPLDLVTLMHDKQIRRTADILDTLLRHEASYAQLSVSFLNGTMLWGANVTSFIVSIINLFLPGNESRQMGRDD